MSEDYERQEGRSRPRTGRPGGCARKVRRSFSLAELMVALGILGVGIVIVAGAFPVAIDQSREAMELSTSQMVFNEAVNQLQTRFTWTELEGLMDPVTIENYGLDLFPTNDQERYLERVLIDNDHNPANTHPEDVKWYIDPEVLADDNYPARYQATKTYQDPTNNNAVTPIFAYTADKTYGWLATVQKVPNKSKCYLFTVFILREPTGVLNNARDFKFSVQILREDDDHFEWDPPTGTVRNNPNDANSKLIFDLHEIDAIPSAFRPQRNMFFLADNQQLYKVIEMGEETGGHNQTTLCDRQVFNGYSNAATPANAVRNVNAIAFPYAATGVTRKVPTIAVYHAILSY